jgi:hypothetical protein
VVSGTLARVASAPVRSLGRPAGPVALAMAA